MNSRSLSAGKKVRAVGLVLAIITFFAAGMPVASATTTVFHCEFGTYAVDNGVVISNTGCQGSIILDESVTAIGEGAFANSTFDQIDGSQAILLTTIGAHAFENSIFDHISLPESPSLTTIGAYAFKNSTFSYIDFYNSPKLATLGEHAFEKSTFNLIDITSEHSLTTIGAAAFANSTFRYLDISDDLFLTTIGAYAFANSTIGDLFFNGDALLDTVGEYAFHGARDFFNVGANTVVFTGTLPQNVDRDAFSGVDPNLHIIGFNPNSLTPTPTLDTSVYAYLDYPTSSSVEFHLESSPIPYGYDTKIVSYQVGVSNGSLSSPIAISPIQFEGVITLGELASGTSYIVRHNVTYRDSNGGLSDLVTYNLSNILSTSTTVSGITVAGAVGVTSVTAGSTLQMTSSVLPFYATDQSFTWSIAPGGTGSATISASGLLSSTSPGTVIVTATANDGSGVAGTRAISILPVTSNPRPTITAPTPINGTAGRSLTAQLILGGGTGSEIATVSSSSLALPAGLILSSSGAITGTPTVAGTTSVSFIVTDSLSETATATSTFVIAAATVPANPPAPMPPAPDPIQTSSISTITQNCPVNGNSVVINGSFSAKISNISVNGRLIDSSNWKQSSSQVSITFATIPTGPLQIQIYSGQAPVLPEQTITLAAACPTPTPTPEMGSINAPITVRVGAIQPVGFAFNVYALSPVSTSVMDKVRLSSVSNLIVYGYASKTGGTESINMKISVQRALSVKKLLLKKYPELIIKTQGMGTTPISVCKPLKNQCALIEITSLKK